ncbi:MAG TPA: SRPBCC family protein [Candidatus Elarobacter sp.]|nr:SRPBCC family protein [Candidatus Elarobacter sp.]
MVQDRIEREVVIAAAPERVWEIITQAKHVGEWFGDYAEIDFRPGGTILLRWDKYGTQYATIENIDEPRYFSYRWNPGSADEKPSDADSTLVEFTLTPVEGQTRLRVVETGFSRLSRNESERAEQFENNNDGWATQLRDLLEYVKGLAA